MLCAQIKLLACLTLPILKNHRGIILLRTIECWKNLENPRYKTI